MYYDLHGAISTLSIARLVMHNGELKGRRLNSPFSARLARPRHEWRGSHQRRSIGRLPGYAFSYFPNPPKSAC